MGVRTPAQMPTIFETAWHTSSIAVGSPIDAFCWALLLLVAWVVYWGRFRMETYRISTSCSAAIRNGSVATKPHSSQKTLISKLDSWKTLPAKVLVSSHLYGHAAAHQYQEWLRVFEKNDREVYTVEKLLRREVSLRKSMKDSVGHPVFIALTCAHRLDQLYHIRQARKEERASHRRDDCDLGYLTHSFRPYGFDVCTVSRQAAISDLTQKLIDGDDGVAGSNEKEKWPHFFITSLPRQGKSLMLDETRRQLLDLGHFCVAITYNGATSISEVDMDLKTMANGFWKRALEQLHVYAPTTWDALGLNKASISVFTFQLFQDVVEGAWPKLLEYHPALKAGCRPVILVDEFGVLLDQLSDRYQGTANFTARLKSALSSITMSHDSVNMAFTGFNIGSTHTMSSASSRGAKPIPLLPIAATNREELSDMMLMFSVAEIPLGAEEYNAYKTAPGLLGAAFQGVVIPWRSFILRLYTIKREELFAMIDLASMNAVNEVIVSCSSTAGAALQEMSLGLAENHPENPSEFAVRLHPAPLFWLSNVFSIKPLLLQRDWWLAVRDFVGNVEMRKRPGVQALLTVSRFTASVMKHRGQHFGSGGTREGLESWAGGAVLECAVALMAAYRLCVDAAGSSLSEYLQDRPVNKFPCVHKGWTSPAPAEEKNHSASASKDELLQNVKAWAQLIQQTGAGPTGAAVFLTKSGDGKDNTGGDVVVVIEVKPPTTEAIRPVTIRIYEVNMGVDRKAMDDRSAKRATIEEGMSIFCKESPKYLGHFRITHLEFIHMVMRGSDGGPATAASGTVIKYTPWGSKRTRNFLRRSRHDAGYGGLMGD